METSEPHITVTDGVCGSGKTQGIFELINELSPAPSYGDPPLTKFIFVTPFLMECHRIAGSVPIEIPVEHASLFPEFTPSDKSEFEEGINLEQRKTLIDGRRQRIFSGDIHSRKFILPSKLRGSRLIGLKDALHHNNDIVITHSLFNRFDQEILNTVRRFNNYILIIDEAPNVFSSSHSLLTPELSINDLDNMERSGNITYSENNVVTWRDTSQVQNWEVFKSTMSFIKENRIVKYSYRGRPILFCMHNPEVYKTFNQVHLLTYKFDGSICKSYFDTFGVTWQLRAHERFEPINYKDKIRLHNTRDTTISSFNNNSLSKSWYESNHSELTFLTNAVSRFFTNSSRKPFNHRLWTLIMGSKKKFLLATKGRGFDERNFLQIAARATNSYMHVEAMAYLSNRFLEPTIKNYFHSQGYPIDEEQYALGEMLQWVFRSGIRNGNELDLFIPSPRMKRLFVTWLDEMESLYTASLISEEE